MRADFVASALLLAAALFVATDASRAGLAGARRLQEISVGRQRTDFSIRVFTTSSGTPDGSCFITGYPTSRPSNAVPGPLTVTVIVGDKVVVSFEKDDGGYVQNYNYSGATDSVKLSQNESYGLINATFTPTEVGQAVTIISGLIVSPNPPTQPSCMVNLTFVAIAPPPPPPPPASPPPPPPASPPPANDQACISGVPCFCQGNYCFNNGAQLTTTCKAPSGQTGCKLVSIAPSQLGAGYAYGYGSSVTVCQCQAATG